MQAREFDQLMNDLESSHASIAQLIDENARLEADLTRALADLAERDEHVRELCEENAALEEQLARLEAANDLA